MVIAINTMVRAIRKIVKEAFIIASLRESTSGSSYARNGD
jgi:hypothetical protein